MLLRCFLLASIFIAGCSESQSKKPDQRFVQPPQSGHIDAGAKTMGVKKMGDKDWVALVVKVDKIVYRFHDASVPPPDHRSYTITLTPSEIAKKVDSYGDIVSEQANALVGTQFDALKDMLAGLSAAVQEKDPKQAECTGGTGNSLQLFAGEQEVYSQYLSSCGSSPQSALHTQFQEIGRAVEALLLPSTDGLTTRP